MSAPDDVRARFEAAWKRSVYSHCATPNESFKEIAEQFYRAARADMAGEVRELVEALKLARDYAAYVQGEPADLAVMDAALAKFTHQEKP